MALWNLIVPYDLWVVRFVGIAVWSIVMDVEWSYTEGGGIDNICNAVKAPLSYGYTASYNVAAGQCVVLNGSSRIDSTFACIIFEGNWNTQQSIVARWSLACIHCPHHPLVCCLYRKGWE
jgi:hypothetical protein